MGNLFRPKEYFRPNTVNKTISLLSECGDKAKIIAGGTDLLIEKPPEVEYLIDIASLPLDYIKADEEGIAIGALTTFNSIENSDLLQEGAYSILIEAAKGIGYNNLRNLATIGGNICNAVPSADSPPALIALDANAKIVGHKGERIVKLEDFFKHVRKTILDNDEMLVEIQIPQPPNHTGAAFLKIGRTSLDIALINVAVSLCLDENGICENSIIVLGAVAPTPIRAKRAEMLLKGKEINKTIIENTAQIASEEIKPINDVRYSADYRRKASRVLVKRAIEKALENVIVR